MTVQEMRKEGYPLKIVGNGDHAAVVVGDMCEYGEDPGELVIKNAQVIEILA